MSYEEKYYRVKYIVMVASLMAAGIIFLLENGEEIFCGLQEAASNFRRKIKIAAKQKGTGG